MCSEASSMSITRSQPDESGLPRPTRPECLFPREAMGPYTPRARRPGAPCRRRSRRIRRLPYCLSGTSRLDQRARDDFPLGKGASAAQANVALTQISSDPFTNPTSQHATEVEPDTFAFGSTIVAAFQQGRFVSGGGASGIGWATSTDAGANWVHGSLPGITRFAGNGPYDRATDPVVAYDAKHGVWLIASLGKHQATGTWDVLVSRSTDGRSWSTPVTVALNPAHGFFDKPWIACDDSPTSPFYGHCYQQWTDFVGACSQHVQLSTSTDGGLTWGPVETPANTASATGGQPVVQPNGTVIVPITGGCNQNSLLV